ncbi:uncharacterized protein FYW49_015333 [Xenentodon cancila]
MQQCYNRAAEFRGTGSLQKMRETIMRHVHESKNSMFDQAKDEMLNQLNSLMEGILQTLRKTMKKSIELSLKTEEHSIPVAELASYKKAHPRQLKSSGESSPS